MDYGKIYQALCERSQKLHGLPRHPRHRHPQHERNYYETHHVLPRCMGGTNESKNFVWLTAREHVIAHLLLAKMYPKNYGLVHAAWRMINPKSQQGTQLNKQINSRIAAGLKERYAVQKSAAMKAQHADPASAFNTPERIANLKAALSNPELLALKGAKIKALHADPNSAYNTPECRAAKSKAIKAAFAKPEVKARKSAAQRAAMNKPEVKAKHDAANAKPEVKARRSASLTKLADQLKTSKQGDPMKPYPEGTIGAELFKLAEQMSAELGYVVLIPAFKARAVELGFKSTSAACSHRHWRKYKSLTAANDTQALQAA